MLIDCQLFFQFKSDNKKIKWAFIGAYCNAYIIRNHSKLSSVCRSQIKLHPLRLVMFMFIFLCSFVARSDSSMHRLCEATSNVLSASGDWCHTCL